MACEVDCDSTHLDFWRLFTGIIMNKPSIVDVVKSVLASFFGVQSDKNRRRDFQHGNPMQFILVGIVLTILFIVAMIIIVKIILASAA